MLQKLKTFLLTSVGVPPQTLLVLFGLGCYLATCLVLRRPLTWPWALVPGLVLSVALECSEIWNYYGAEGLLKASSHDIGAILLRHSKDILLMNAAPVLVFVTALALSKLLAE